MRRGETYLNKFKETFKLHGLQGCDRIPSTKCDLWPRCRSTDPLYKQKQQSGLMVKNRRLMSVCLDRYDLGQYCLENKDRRPGLLCQYGKLFRFSFPEKVKIISFSEGIICKLIEWKGEENFHTSQTMESINRFFPYVKLKFYT